MDSSLTLLVYSRYCTYNIDVVGSSTVYEYRQYCKRRRTDGGGKSRRFYIRYYSLPGVVAVVGYYNPRLSTQSTLHTTTTTSCQLSILNSQLYYVYAHRRPHVGSMYQKDFYCLPPPTLAWQLCHHKEIQ